MSIGSCSLRTVLPSYSKTRLSPSPTLGTLTAGHIYLSHSSRLCLIPPIVAQTRKFTNMAPVTSDNKNLDLTPRVVYGPSGVGKGTIISDVRDKFPNIIGHSVSHTTRKPREGEQDGRHYHFVDAAEFKRLIGEGAFIEHAVFNNTHYGTSWNAVKAVKDEGKIAILDIEIEGVKQLRARTDFPAKFLYLGPPSREELARRLRGRGTDSDEHIQNRLKQAEVEMAYAEADGAKDDRLINDDLETTKKKFREWLGLSEKE